MKSIAPTTFLFILTTLFSCSSINSEKKRIPSSLGKNCPSGYYNASKAPELSGSDELIHAIFDSVVKGDGGYLLVKKHLRISDTLLKVTKGLYLFSPSSSKNLIKGHYKLDVYTGNKLRSSMDLFQYNGFFDAKYETRIGTGTLRIFPDFIEADLYGDASEIDICLPN